MESFDLTSYFPLVLDYIGQHLDAMYYLTPSLLLAVGIRLLSPSHPLFFLLHLSGTACHESAHFTVGVLTGARPQSVSLIPKRMGDSWQLGVVTFTNVHWYNAAPMALAPFLILLIPFLVALWRTSDGLHFGLIDLPLAFLLAPQFLAFWPSSVDWKVAMRSWPYPFWGLAIWWLAASFFPEVGFGIL